ncbi:MAG: NrfD/PsrC family molybdoenzyme membrane anchor subunit [Anaerolineae bacterium]
MTASPYASQVITKAPPWTGLTALDIFFNNLSIGTFLAATFATAFAPGRFAGLTLVAYPVALLLLLIDLTLLISDLGDPKRFHHMLRVFKLSSPMSFGTWSLSAYGVLLGIATVAAVLHWPMFAGLQSVGPLWTLVVVVGTAAALLAVIPAIGGILYKGVLFSVTSQPSWKDARWLGAYIGNSAVLLGCSLLLIIAAVMGRDAAAAMLRGAMVALLVLDVIFFWLLFRGIAPTFKARYGPNQTVFYWLTVVAAGWLLPFFLLLQGSFVELIPPLFIALAALAVRYAVVFLAHGRQAT